MASSEPGKYSRRRQLAEYDQLTQEFDEEQRNIDMGSSELHMTQNFKSAPIYKLSNDILSIIFETALAMQHHASKRSNRLPLNVSQVSHMWRDVALSTASLWTQVYLPLEYGSHSFYGLGKRVFEWVELMMARSKEASLSISLCGPRDVMQPEVEKAITNLRSILDILGPRFTRCQTLHIVVRDIDIFRMIYGLCCIEMERLEVLTLSQGPYAYRAQILNVRLPMKTHCIRRLTLSHVSLRLSHIGHDISSLTDLDLDNASLCLDKDPGAPAVSQGNSPRDLKLSVDAFREATNLQTLSLRRVFLQFPNNDEVIPLDNLKSLSLAIDDRQSPLSIIKFMRHMSMPLVETFSVQGVAPGSAPLLLDKPPLDRLLMDLAKQLPQLKKLSIDDSRFSSEELLNLLAALPDIRVLHLRKTLIPDKLLTGLKPRKVVICPNLIELAIRDRLSARKNLLPGYKPFSAKTLLGLLQSRHSEGYEVKKFVLVGHVPHWKPDELEGFEKYVGKFVFAQQESFHARNVPGEKIFDGTDTEVSDGSDASGSDGYEEASTDGDEDS